MHQRSIRRKSPVLQDIVNQHRHGVFRSRKLPAEDKNDGKELADLLEAIGTNINRSNWTGANFGIFSDIAKVRCLATRAKYKRANR